MSLTTRRQLRRDILRGLGDLRVLTATSDGTDVDFRDTINLNGEPNLYRGRELLLVQGTSDNIGQIRYITGSSQNLSAVGFGDALPAATTLGDVAEMINTRGTGYHFQEVHDAINMAIRNISDRALVPVPMDLTSYSLNDAIAIPPEFVTVEDVQWLDSYEEDKWHSVRKAPRSTGSGWWVDRAGRTINFVGRITETMNGQSVRMWGLAEPEQLFSDSDETTIDPEYLTMQARATLSFERYLRAPTPESERINFMFEQRAGYLRGKVLTRRGPFSEELR